MAATDPDPPLPPTRSNELHISITHISRLYTDETGWFPIHSRAGNQYMMVAYHCDANVILVCPFALRKDVHRMGTYDTIMPRLQAHGLDVDLQILDNEVSAAYKQKITTEWDVKLQLVPPDMHRRNAVERAIRTWKAHFLPILAGVAPDFPRHLWDLLIPQAELALNLLRQATLNLHISAWEYF